MRIWGAIAALLFVSACAGTSSRVKSGDAPVVIRDAASLAAHVTQGAGSASISGTAEVRVDAPERRSASLAFLLRAPDQVRIDAMTVFGIPVASIAARRGVLTVFQHGENRYIAGPVTAPGARQFLLVPLSPPEFIALATGRPLLDGYTAVEDGFHAGSQAVAATYEGPGGKRLTISVSNQTGRVRELIYQFPRHTLRLKFKQWREAKGRWLPAQVIVDGGEQLRAEVELGDWEFGEAATDEDFWIPPPEGATYYRFEG